MADVAGDISTTASIAVGGTVSDSLEIAGDHDWYRIDLTQGQEITVTLNGITLTDPYLWIRDSAGNVIYDNDDGGSGLNSAKSFAAPTTGTYYIDVGAWNNQGSGTYQLGVAPFAYPPIFTNDQIADQLRSDYWNGDAHHFAVGPGGSITVNLTGLTTAGSTLAIAALQDWTDITGIQFAQVTTGAQITFDDNQAGAFTDASWSGESPLRPTSTCRRNGSINTAPSSAHTAFKPTFTRSAMRSVSVMPATTMSQRLILMTPYSGTTAGPAASCRTSILRKTPTPRPSASLAMSSLPRWSPTSSLSRRCTVFPRPPSPVTPPMAFIPRPARPGLNATQFSNVAYTIYDSGGIDTLDYSGLHAQSADHI